MSSELRVGTTLEIIINVKEAAFLTVQFRSYDKHSRLLLMCNHLE